MPQGAWNLRVLNSTTSDGFKEEEEQEHWQDSAGSSSHGAVMLAAAMFDKTGPTPTQKREGLAGRRRHQSLRFHDAEPAIFLVSASGQSKGRRFRR